MGPEIGAGTAAVGLKAAGVAGGFLDSYYKGKKKLEDEPRRVGNAEDHIEFQREELRKFGLENERIYNERQKEAEAQVRKGKNRIQKKGKTKVYKDAGMAEPVKQYTPKCFAYVVACLLPSSADKGTEIMEACANAAAETAKDRGEGRAAFQTEAQICPPFASRPSSKDVLCRYVLLEKTTNAVKYSLTCSHNRVTWLYGKAGTGKTGVLHELFRQFEDEAEISVPNQEPPKFRNVIYLDLGRECKHVEMKRAILKYLGWKEDRIFNARTGLKNALSRADGLLFMFDNLCSDRGSKDFLQEMLDLSGYNVQFLVASRENYEWKLNIPFEHGACDSKGQCSSSTESRMLPRGVNCIEIQNIGLQDARKIFEGHMREGEIVRDWAIVDERIKQTGGNALAISSLGASYDHSDDGWSQAMTDPSTVAQHLKCEDTAHICSVKYPQESCWRALQDVHRNLSLPSQRLLTLMNMFQKPDCPEEIVHFLMKSMGPINSGDFSIARKELSRQGIVQSSERVVEGLRIPGGSCNGNVMSIAPLDKLFLDNDDHTRKREKSLCELAEGWWKCDSNSGSEEENLNRKCLELLGILYLKPEIASRAKVILHKSKAVEARMHDIELITRLFVHDKNRDWTAILYTSARQLVMTYICDGKLPKSPISDLLSAKLSFGPMWTTLNLVLTSGSDITIDDGTISPGALKLLFAYENALEIFRSYGSRLRKEIQRALVQIADQADKKAIFDLTGARDLLMKSVTSDCTELQQQGLNTLANLAKGSLEYSWNVVSNSEVMRGLNSILSKGKNPDLRREAAGVFVSLTFHKDKYLCTRIRESPGALDKLFGCMSTFTEPRLQVLASFAVAELVPSRNHARELQEYMRRLDKLVEALAADSNPCLQINFAVTLARLACVCGVSLIPEAVAGLVAALSKKNHGLQEHAAYALSNLTDGASGEHLACKYKDLPLLLKVLDAASSNPDLQILTNAACAKAFRNLSKKVDAHGLNLPNNALQRFSNGIVGAERR